MMQKKGGFFASLLVIVLIAFSLELSARHFFISETLIGKKWTHFNESFKDAKTVVVGACPLAYGFDPNAFSEKVYNFAYLDEEIYYSMAFFEKMLSEGSQVQNLIVELDPYLFYSKEYFTVGENDELAHQRIFIRDSLQNLGVKPEIRWGFADRLFSRSYFLLFKEVYFEKLFDCLMHGNCQRVENPEMTSSGQLPKSHSFKSTGDYGDSQKIEQMKSEVERDINVSLSKENGERNLRYLEKMVELANQHQVQIFLVHPPFYSEFSKIFKENLPQDYFSFYDETVKKLTRSSNVRYFDFQNLFLGDPQERELFFDLIHINKEGSVRFTQRLEEAIGKMK